MTRHEAPNARANRRVAPHLRSRPREEWRPENRAVPEEYADWLIRGGIGPSTVHNYHRPLIHLVLGLVDKPWGEIDPKTDFTIVMEHYHARGICERSLEDRRWQLQQLARYLRQRRGEPDPPDIRPLNFPVYFQGLPEWLTTVILAYGQVREQHWKPSCRHQRWIGYLGRSTLFWRWLFAQKTISAPAELCREDVVAYLEERLATGRSTSTANLELLALQEFLRYLQAEKGWDIPEPVLRIRPFPQPPSLPRYLTDEEVIQLRDLHEQAVVEASTPNKRRDALLDRACFYLLWHGGLRCGEITDLLLADLDLPGKRLRITRSKGAKDRTVYLTAVVVAALQEYLAVRGPAVTNHVFVYRHRPLCKDLVRGRLKAKGKRVGIRAYPYRLRHTCATQLLNAGARLETIQYQLGHDQLHTTQVYARVYDETAATDYYQAIAEVEERLTLVERSAGADAAIWPRLLHLLEEISRSCGDPERQEAAVAEMRRWIVLKADAT